MAELVRVKSVVHGDGKATITVELDIDEFWEDQLTRNKELRVAKRPLLAALEYDSTHGPYISLLPVFAKLDVENLANPHDKPTHYGFEHLPIMRVQRIPSLEEFCKGRGIEIKATENGDAGEGEGVI